MPNLVCTVCVSLCPRVCVCDGGRPSRRDKRACAYASVLGLRLAAASRCEAGRYKQPLLLFVKSEKKSRCRVFFGHTNHSQPAAASVCLSVFFFPLPSIKHRDVMQTQTRHSVSATWLRTKEDKRHAWAAGNSCALLWLGNNNQEIKNVIFCPDVQSFETLLSPQHCKITMVTSRID